MGKNPLVTAIITTYKRHPTIVCRAVQSIINQTYEPIELIVVDDSPSNYQFRNEVEKAIKELAPSVVFIKNEVNKGACVSRNIGAHLAKGDFLGFLDDDDEWYPQKIEMMITHFTAEDIALVYCGANRIDENGDEKEIIVEWKKGKTYKELLKWNFIGSVSFPLINKQAFFEAGEFDPEMKSSQDHDMWLRIAKIKDIDYVNKPLVRYYLHSGEQITKNKKAVIQGQERILEKYHDDIIMNKNTYWKRTLMLSSAYGNDHQIRNSFLKWIRAVFLKPFYIHDNLSVLYFSIIKKIFSRRQ